MNDTWSKTRRRRRGGATAAAVAAALLGQCQCGARVSGRGADDDRDDGCKEVPANS